MDSSRTPEQAARAGIDALLSAAGWIVQDCRAFNPTADHGIALREALLRMARAWREDEAIVADLEAAMEQFSEIEAD